MGSCVASSRMAGVHDFLLAKTRAVNVEKRPRLHTCKGNVGQVGRLRPRDCACRRPQAS